MNKAKNKESKHRSHKQYYYSDS